MTGLTNWLEQATRHLSADAVAQVRAEIQEHYESAREAAVGDGASVEEADRLAVSNLGDPCAANRQYRSVMLTSAEARLLREGNWEARAVCSRPWLKWMLAAFVLAALAASAAAFVTGATALALALLLGSLTMSYLFAAPLLPIYTPSRGRAFRYGKWIVLLAMLAAFFGRDAFKLSWLLFSCLWPMVWIEMTRASIRRKLPVARWPKQLYL